MKSRAFKKINNKAFTVVELLASFTITMIILIFLLEILLEVKNIYYENEIKTAVYNKNAIIASALNKRLSEYKIEKVSNTSDTIIGTNCSSASENDDNLFIEVTKDNNLNERLYFYIAISKENTPAVSIRGCDNMYDFEDIIVKMPSATSIDAVDISNYGVFNGKGKRDSYLKIAYSVKSNKLTDEINFNYIYTYSNNTSQN